MLDVFKQIKNPELKGLIVWVPMVPGDSFLAASSLVSPDKRFTVQGWDSKLHIGDVIGKTLHLKRTAWDVYLVYNPGVQWTDELPPAPSFWMHQLHGEDPELHLQPEKLTTEVRKALDENPGREPDKQEATQANSNAPIAPPGGSPTVPN